MNKILKIVSLLAAFVCLSVNASAQSGNNVTATLVDNTTGETLGYATVSLTQKGDSKVYKYVLSTDAGAVKFEGVKKGTYIFKAELMGYKEYSQEIIVKGDTELGSIKVLEDKEVLEAANVSATGNPVIIKKDTIEYNATSFKTTENDVLEDLLKKLPGVEIDDNGSITVNGQAVNKITIQGKTFFLDDPQLASKNLPAKMINKVKVVRKKSEQAEFTGIDDGEEETVIDLGVRPGMMQGVFGNVTAGAGHDMMPDVENNGDYRYLGSAFVGNFKENQQLSLILNGNNTNNRGFNDRSGNMMGNMRGGGRGMGGGMGGFGRGNGITTSYMGGINGAWDLFDNRMQLGGNYLYNHSDNDVLESSSKTTFLTDRNQINNSDGMSTTSSGGHRVGIRLEHKFSENTSILFEPQINFGTGNFIQSENSSTDTDYLNGKYEKTNISNSNNGGDNKSLSTSGFFLLRQRLGIPGRTLTAMSRYSYSDNNLDSYNLSNVSTGYDDATGQWNDVSKVDQTIDQNSHSASVMGRVTYTEPLGNDFYVEANYGYTWSKSTSTKNTFDNLNGGILDETYSNNIINESSRHDIGANLMYQKDKGRAQIGFAAIPTHTFNSTTRDGKEKTYTDDRWKFSPRAMVFWDFNDNANIRLFYRGSSEQPSTSQLMPVPDNTDPLNISFGNPSLVPYFSHSLNGEFRYSNKEKFSSVNVGFNGGYVQEPIISAIWYGPSGEQYSMPFNGPSTANAGMNMFANIPIAKSNFSINNMFRMNWSKNASLVEDSAHKIPINDYYDDGELNYDDFLKDYAEGRFGFIQNKTKTISGMERLRVRYRTDFLELSVSGRTRVNRSWYTISTLADNTTTWNNQLNSEIIWTFDQPGITLRTDFNYNWYNGYSTDQPEEYVWNAQIQKLLFKKKVTMAIMAYDILNQSKNLSVTDTNNYHRESLNNTLGRYIVVTFSYRFGTMGGNRQGGMGGPGMGGPGMGGPGMGGGRPR